MFKDLLKKPLVILDGAMGTMLQNAGVDTGHVPELLNITKPEAIMAIHRAYAENGSDIIYANTFGANRYNLKDTGYSVQEIVSAGISNARKVCGTALVAHDIGSLGQLLEPTGTLSFEEAYDAYAEMIIAGHSADLIVIETQTDLYEVKAALLAAKENSSLPVLCTMSFDENGRTFNGTCLEAMAVTLEGLGADAIGINCSLGPDKLLSVVTRLARVTKLPIIAKPNAGMPDPVTGKFSVGAEEFLESVIPLIRAGATVVGGCCGTTPKHIRQLAAYGKSMNAPVTVEPRAPQSYVSSACTCIEIDRPRIIGERINPTGKKLFKEALRNGDIGYITRQAVEQVNGGADILDVNVGLAEIDEKEMMVKAVKAIQSVTGVPLQLDSTRPDVLEAGLRIYNGKPIVNSVNGEKASLDAILPLVKKYGASVVGLTLDENGIPKTAEGRFEIAERILNAALSYGIPKEDVYIDCLTLTASAEQASVMATLDALSRVKNELGLKTVLGVSNVSFGLPNRELLTASFLAMALRSGLDMPIINPNTESVAGVVRAYKVLKNIDGNCRHFIEKYSATAASATTDGTMDILTAIGSGLKEESKAAVLELLKTVTPMDIIDSHLVPALDIAGSRYEKGEIFLPQLLMTAEAAQECFAVIRNELAKSGEIPESKGTIVMATVKGDIHDIGKNIVKVLLESYGFRVIDLGRDVDKRIIVDAAIEYQVKLVGLSALMTTTLSAMEETVALLAEECPECKVMVGGAVLTQEYAEKIGAHFYGKDAKESVGIAQEVFSYCI